MKSEIQVPILSETYDSAGLEGNIGENSSSRSRFEEDEFSRLEEPVKVTVMREVKAIGNKFKHVAFPKQDKLLLREWDLWGPLVICTFMAFLLEDDGSGNSGPGFAEVFVIFWIGAVVVTINSWLLGGTLSFFQSVCVLGYCVLPLAIALFFCFLLHLAPAQYTALFLVRLLIVLISLIWSVFASNAFLGGAHAVDKKLLAVYPLFLFYLIMSWMVVSYKK